MSLPCWNQQQKRFFGERDLKMSLSSPTAEPRGTSSASGGYAGLGSCLPTTSTAQLPLSLQRVSAVPRPSSPSFPLSPFEPYLRHLS